MLPWRPSRNFTLKDPTSEAADVLDDDVGGGRGPVHRHTPQEVGGYWRAICRRERDETNVQAWFVTSW